MQRHPPMGAIPAACHTASRTQNISVSASNVCVMPSPVRHFSPRALAAFSKSARLSIPGAVFMPQSMQDQLSGTAPSKFTTLSVIVTPSYEFLVAQLIEPHHVFMRAACIRVQLRGHCPVASVKHLLLQFIFLLPLQPRGLIFLPFPGTPVVIDAGARRTNRIHHLAAQPQ